ncbi:Uroplakin-1b [Acipenser ruthenus]|uniref:Uroplakin-1b n=1 Tax=Acipenser ruthenus TaxID=7906 RepID=A0A444U892_ACIRT|nr:Uroplakin-1b [Acipenser ruthenus]
MVYEGGNDSIFRGTWIGLFTGLAYFCTSILGMYCIMKSKRILLLVFVPNMFLKQMLRRYNKPLPEAMPSTLDEIYMTSGITHSWNRFMTEKQCCGVYGPQDWGCFDFMGGPLQRQAWGVGWFGFAIQCWTVSIYS